MTLQSGQQLSPALNDVQLRLSVDPVLFTLREHDLRVLLRRRRREPFTGLWALPGAINPAGEQITDTIVRQLRRMELADIRVDQLKTFDRPAQYFDGTLLSAGRDPRGRVVSVAYVGLVSPERDLARLPADEYRWTSVNDLPVLAFDHSDIVNYAYRRLRNKILNSSVASELMPPAFTLTQLQQAYELVLDKKLDKRNFRRKMLAAQLVVETGDISRTGTRRPARLCRFVERERDDF